MKALRRAWRRLSGAFFGYRHDAELDAEVDSHIQMLTEANVRRGMTPSEARRAARMTFGGVDKTKESYRDQRGIASVEAMRQDIRHAVRGMRKNPGFTAVAVGCLALGIGANTAIFTIFNAIMLRSLPVSHPEELVTLKYQSKSYPRSFRKTGSGYGSTSLPYSAFEAMRNGARTVSGICAFVPLGFNNRSVTVGMGGQSTVASGEMVSGNYFSVLGAQPIIGRAISDADLRPGSPNVAVISDAFWSRQFGREPTAIGRNVTLNHASFTIIGVAPPGFFGVDPELAPDLWIPLRDMAEIKPWGIQGREFFHNRFWWWCMMMGRLKPGITADQARAELDVLFQHSITEGIDRLPPAEQIPHISLAPASRGLEILQQRVSKPLHILLVAVSLVLLIACTNLAILLLARANSRQREIGIRVAIGASRSRLVRQFLTESVVLSLCGGVLGLLLSQWGSRALILMSRAGHPIALSLYPDATVLEFTAGVSVLTGILFGLVPALRATKAGISGQLKEQAAASSPRTVLGKALVGIQVALSVCLLFGAGLFVRTLQKLEAQDFGFQRDHLLLFELDPRTGGYKAEQITGIYDEALRRIQALPGVRSASISAFALLSGWVNNGSAATDGPPLPDGQPNRVHWNVIGPNFVETMGIPIVLGRGVGWNEMAARRVAVVNESMAHRFFPKENPVGHRFSFGTRYDPANDFEIVGVVRNAKYDSVRNEAPPTAYVPYSSQRDSIGRMCFEVRTAADPLAMTSALREAIRGIDPTLPLIGIKTQEQQVDEALTAERMFAKISSFFGLLALFLVVVGLYGTLAYAVVRRTGEIGIRMALGARRTQVLWMVLRESLIVVTGGLAAGLPAVLALTRFITSMLYGVKAYDTATIALTVLVLSAAGAAAGLLPASRAARVDPIQALHFE